ncbi:MAG: glycosidase, partial [Cloacibacterium sp.]|nr:glycosidase [Cloacibacterium sp.]
MIMMNAKDVFLKRKKELEQEYQTLIEKPNSPKNEVSNGIFTRYSNPVVTAKHIPLDWRYDFNEKENPLLLERIGYNAAFNAGAIQFNDKYILCVRVEGNDRKSFFAIAESENGIDHFKFWEKPCVIPQIEG